ncbi:MAG: adenylosuccinate lyase [Pirellulales bacterium]
MTQDAYDNPLIARYSSTEMSALWSPQRKFSTWRRLWVALAEAEAELGLPITPAQLAELRAHVDDIDFAAAERYERQLRHDVMAHVHAYGDQCPAARPIIHLGATSCYVTDNTDLLLLREALELVRARLVRVIDRLATFAHQYRALPCLAFTHLQSAQPTTVGKRACLWAYDLVQDLDEVEFRLSRLRALGVRGTTGTQASFLKLFDGDHAKVRRLEQLVGEEIGLHPAYPVSGQTYPRKVDAGILATLSGIGQSAHKAGTDLRILQHRHEVEEPFETSQIGSSAMPYKRNPMRAERMCALARFAISLVDGAAQTAATQWFERTLDDSALRRLTLPQAFLSIDAVLLIYQNLADGLVVHPQVIARHLNEELPFMATENVLMAAASAGGDRQDLHERIRQHSVAAAKAMREQGAPNDLLARLAADPAFAGVDLRDVADPGQYVGRAPQQVDEFLEEVIAPLREHHAALLPGEAELRV